MPPSLLGRSRHKAGIITHSSRPQLLSDPIAYKIVGGDLNAVLDGTEDRRGTSGTPQLLRTPPTTLSNFLSSSNLIDSWRTIHPDGREFTHFSHAHNSKSRINYMLLSQGLLQRVESVPSRDLVISD